MAVDAHNLFLSPPQLFSNRESMMQPTNSGFCNNNQTGYGVISPPPPLLNMYAGVDTIPTTVDSFTNYNAADVSANPDCDFLPLPTRKRAREFSRSSYYQHHLLLLLQNNRSSSSSSTTCVNNSATTTTSTTPFSFLAQDIDISSHLNQQQYEIDRFINLHMERVKYEIEEKKRTLMAAIEQRLVKRLRVKEEERERISKINHALEERVKSLSIEIQIWRDLAQTNEATANNLRANLEQILAQVNNDQNGAGLDNNVNEEDDAQSFCGSSSDETVKRTVDMKAQDNKMCRNCGEEESCVLLLPCRHLCLCGVCGSSVHTCPICRSPKNASVHVNMSS